jgi:hypothetical protein
MNSAQVILDRITITTSSLCALHCAVLPIIIALSPVALSALSVDHEWFHQVLALMVIPMSFVALTMGCRKHEDKTVLLLGITGVVCLVSLAFFGHEILGEVGERVGTLLCSLLIAIAHLRNYFLCREDTCEHEEDACSY